MVPDRHGFPQLSGRVPAHRVVSMLPALIVGRSRAATDRDRVTMSSTTAADSSLGADPLAGLFQEVVDARAAMKVARRAPLGTSSVVDVSRRRLLVALEAFTAELDSRHLPVPYAIRDDLRIQRRTLGKTAGFSG